MFMLICTLTVLSSYLYRNPVAKTSKHIVIDDEDNEEEGKADRLLEMFPQLTRTELLEVSF